MKKHEVIPVPQGFSFSSQASGFRYQGRDDLALLYSAKPACFAGVFTLNKFQAAPVLVGIEELQSGKKVRAVMINAGQANACTGEQGLANCRETLRLAASALKIKPAEIVPASTGVIGAQLKMELWPEAAQGLAAKLGERTPLDAAKAIMTTDTFPKLAWARMEHEGREVRLLGMAKGSGMICPNMATMIGALVCDAKVDPDWWQDALRQAVDASFNSVTVDGDTSTNDCVLALANGASGLAIDTDESKAALQEALTELCQALAYMIVEDAEGGTKILRIQVRGAADHAQAELAARTVGHSPLVKTAMFGRDANWGRIVAALGRSGADFKPDEVSLRIGGIPVFQNGQPVDADLDALLEPHMRRQDITLDIEIGSGDGEYVLLASDLSDKYVHINADYRS